MRSLRGAVIFFSVLLLAGDLPAQMSEDEVRQVIAGASTHAAQVNSNSLIAVVDREGFVLGVWDVSGQRTDPGIAGAGLNTSFDVAFAVSKAGTAAFLSSNQNAFTTRTAGFIIQQNFPPGINNRPPGPLVGVGLSNLCFSDGNKFRADGTISSLSNAVDPTKSIVPVLGSQLFGSPGGVPLYKNGKLIGGIGVTGDSSPVAYQTNRDDLDEEIAVAGQRGFEPADTIKATGVFIDGISLPYVSAADPFEAPLPFDDIRGKEVAGYPVKKSPGAFPFVQASLGGYPGEIRRAIIDDPKLKKSKIRGEKRLSRKEVTGIISLAAARARHTRAGIRLPVGVPACLWITVIGNPDRRGEPPPILGVYRTGDAPLFSYDVSVQKARTALFFSNDKFASSTRTVGFLAESHYPPGLIGRPAGPYNGYQEYYSITPGTEARAKSLNSPQPGFALGVNFFRTPVPPKAPNPNLPNGITIFPGGFPLYRNGVLIGAIGVSGDGVDQDDLVAASGCARFLAPAKIRADHFIYRGARLPYAKFPRDPGL